MASAWLENMHIYRLTLILIGLVSIAQASDLSLSSPVVNPGATATLGMALTVAGKAPAGVEWAIGYSPAQISGISITSGPAASAAAKSLSCASGAGAATCLLTGMNTNMIGSGVVAWLNATMAPGVTTASIQVSNPIGADPGGTAAGITSAVSSQTINLTAGVLVSNVACNPFILGSQAASTCTVTLKSGASPGGSAVTLKSDNNLLTVSPSVTVPAGATTVNFTATAGLFKVSQVAIVSASLNGSVATASLTLMRNH
jgi:hypothetical protein